MWTFGDHVVLLLSMITFMNTDLLNYVSLSLCHSKQLSTKPLVSKNIFRFRMEIMFPLTTFYPKPNTISRTLETLNKYLLNDK